MEDLESKLSAIMNDPSTMAKLMEMAQSLSSGSTQPDLQQTNAYEKQNTQPCAFQGDRTEEGSSAEGDLLQAVTSQMPDMAMLQKLSGLAGGVSIDKNQQSLLSALSPYLSNYRLEKLKKAMRAARLAKLASGFLGTKTF